MTDLTADIALDHAPDGHRQPALVRWFAALAASYGWAMEMQRRIDRAPHRVDSESIRRMADQTRRRLG